MKIEKIKQHLFIDDVYPAILLEDGTIRIMVKQGEYWDKKTFEEMAELGIPKDCEKAARKAFDYDYNKI